MVWTCTVWVHFLWQGWIGFQVLFFFLNQFPGTGYWKYKAVELDFRASAHLHLDSGLEWSSSGYIVFHGHLFFMPVICSRCLYIYRILFICITCMWFCCITIASIQVHGNSSYAHNKGRTRMLLFVFMNGLFRDFSGVYNQFDYSL